MKLTAPLLVLFCSCASMAFAQDAHECVDLGLSVKWATCNLGATEPESFGDYYAWGETEPKSEYTWSTLKYCVSETGDGFTKYRSNYLDNKQQTLEKADDAAHINWGGDWRMPTNDEFEELVEGCVWTWTTSKGIKGYKVQSRTNGNSIFLPCAGFVSETGLRQTGTRGRYWSSSLSAGRDYLACYLYLGPTGYGTDRFGRCSGRSIRPVCK